MNPVLFQVFDLLAKSASIMLLAYATQSVWRSASAAQRSVVWLTAFGALLLLPLTLLWQPYWSIALMQPEMAAPPPLASSEVLHSTAETFVPAAQPAPSSFHLSFSTGQWLALVWLAGCAVLLAYRAIGSLQLRRLKSQSQPVEDARVLGFSARIAAESGVRRSIALRVSSHVSVPLTWGTLHPVLLLPADALQWDAASLEAALRHEMGHIRHGDALTRLITTFITAFYWPNVLVWLAAKSWRTVQEQAADDLVISSGAAAEDYALQLLEAARGVQAAGGLHAPVMAMAQPSTLETRLSAIMDGSRNRSSYSLRGAVTGLVLAFGMLALCAAAQLRAAPDATAENPLKTKANKLIIASMNLKGASLEQAVAFVRQQATELDPEHKGLNIVIEDPEFEKDVEITLDLITIPISEALYYVGELSNRKVRYEASAIFVGPANAPAKMFTRSYKLPAGGAAKIGNAKSWLTNQGVAFPDGAAVTITPDGTQLIIRNTEGELQNASVFVEALTAGKAVAPASPTTLVLAAKPSPLEAKAAAIIIPRVQFQGATAAEAVEFLRAKSRELDPDKKGLGIVVRAEDMPASATISLDLRDVPLSEALKYTADLLGLSLTVEPYAFILKARGSK
ncbi:M56 family metallopeptidase [Prosthecobacter sp.]|uniref:M56 family metallopeptidase n=1 Tax=Prosthecobacter sp. TaxID=1965333 RepID=UPI00378443AB